MPRILYSGQFLAFAAAVVLGAVLIFVDDHAHLFLWLGVLVGYSAAAIGYRLNRKH